VEVDPQSIPLRKRVKAAKRLRGRWARDVVAGTMSRANYIKKLVGLIEEVGKEITAVVALIAEIQDEIREA
jgi:hypothetical protein